MLLIAVTEFTMPFLEEGRAEPPRGIRLKRKNRSALLAHDERNWSGRNVGYFYIKVRRLSQTSRSGMHEILTLQRPWFSVWRLVSLSAKPFRNVFVDTLDSDKSCTTRSIETPKIFELNLV